MANRRHVRSISFPSRPHPATLKIQQELDKLKTREASSTSTLATICNALSGMEGLYICLDELLGVQSTQQAISHNEHKQWVDELLDGSLRLLDISHRARDIISQFKENVRDLQSALRRRKGDLCIESIIISYICSRKKMNKDAKKWLAAMKKIDSKFEVSPLLDQDHQLHTMIRAIGEVNTISMSIFQSLLLFLSIPVLKLKSSGWSLVSKFVHKMSVSCEEKLGNVDLAVTAIPSKVTDTEKMQIACTRLGALDVDIEGLDRGLKCMFRHLIKTRASLLNMISHDLSLDSCQQPSLPPNPSRHPKF